MKQATVLFSNKHSVLISELERNLLEYGPDAFSKRLIIFPSLAMQEWTLRKLCESKSIVAGVKTAFLDEAMELLSAELFGAKEPISSSVALFFRLYEEIEQQIQKGHSLFAPLAHYLKDKPKRLTTLCFELIKLFERYGVYGRLEPSRWEKNPQNWQQWLWHSIYQHETYPLRKFGALSSPVKVDSTLSVHLFGYSHLPPLAVDFFQKIGELVPTFLYHLSACSEFWSDLRTDKQRLRLPESFDDYFEEHSSLLANFGKVAREFAFLIESRDLATLDLYSAPDETTTLSLLQADLLYLRPPETRQRKADDSIQLHLLSSRYREIENLYHMLLKEVGSGIAPHEILVMAPDITPYRPFIEAFFKEDLDFQMLDIPTSSHNELAKGLLMLLELENNRWSVSALLALFELPAFKRKISWDEKDCAVIKRWIESAGIRWGYDEPHRQRLLKKPTALQGVGTWTKGIDHLLRSLAISEEETLIEYKESELLGHLATTLEALYTDLTLFVTPGIKKTAAEWTDVLSKLCEKFFFAAFEEKREFDEKLHLFSHLPANSAMPFDVFFSFLVAYLKEEKTSIHSTHLKAVRFCSLLPGRILPAKVICLLGMSEESTSGGPTAQALDLLHTVKEKDFFPTKNEVDKALFLEAILAAEKKLLISSYSNDYSSLITDLLAELVSPIVVTHPTLSFDPDYFDGKHPMLVNFSTQDFEIASRVKKEHFFLPEFHVKMPVKKDWQLPPGEHFLAIDELKKALTNPLRLYFQNTLGLYLKENRGLENEEPLTLSAKAAGLFKLKLRKESFEEVREAFSKKGAFPAGLFESVYENRMQEEVQVRGAALEKFALKREQLWQLLLKPGQKSLDFEGKRWVSAPLHFQEGDFSCHIVGKIEGVTPAGLYTEEKSDLPGMIRTLPAFLVLNNLRQIPADIQATTILFGKDGKSKVGLNDPRELLKTLLIYYFRAEKEPSPLYPEWIGAFLEKDERALGKLMKAGFDPKFGTIFDQERLWALQKSPEPSLLIEQWSDVAIALYGGLNEH